MDNAATGAAEGCEAPPIAQQLTRDLTALGAIEREFAALDTALTKLDDGTYWTCETCGEAIDEVVLAATPLARRCAGCGTGGDVGREER